MRIKLHVYDETSELNAIDALLRRDGALVPLKLAFDPHDVGAVDAPSASPGGFEEAEARLGVQASLVVERAAAAQRAVAPMAAVVERVTALHKRVAPMGEAVARVEAMNQAPIGGRLVGAEREETLRKLAPLSGDEAERERLAFELETVSHDDPRVKDLARALESQK